MKIIVNIIMFFFLINMLKASDTVTIDTLNTIYLDFKKEIKYSDLSSAKNVKRPEGKKMVLSNKIALKNKGNILFVKALKPFKYIAPIFIKLKDNKRIIYLKYLEKNSSHYYDISNKNKENDNKDIIELNANRTDTSVSNNLVKTIRMTPPMYNTIGNKKGNIISAVTVIINNSVNTGLKLEIKNNSSIHYKIEDISFMYVFKKNKGFLKKPKTIKEPVFPKHIGMQNKIQPDNIAKIPIVLESFGMDNKGYLQINIEEKTGERDITVKVDSKTLRKAVTKND